MKAGEEKMTTVKTLSTLTREPRFNINFDSPKLILIYLGFTAFTVLVALKQPLALVGLLALPVIPVYLRHLGTVALGLLVASPLLLSSFQVGPLTLDNYGTILGIGTALLWMIQQRRMLPPLMAIFPLTMALAITLTALIVQVDSIAGVIRFIGVAFVPTLILRGGASRRAVTTIFFTVIFIGATSIFVQPLLPTILPPFVDPQTMTSRFGGLMGHPNFAADAMGMATIVLLSAKRIFLRHWLYIAYLGAAMFMTSSLGALGAVALGALIVLTVRGGIMRLLGIAFAAILGVATVGASLLDRVGAVTGQDQKLNSLDWRYEHWAQALQLPGDKWPIGIGWQQVGALMPDGLEAHSAYVEIWVELGLIGTLIALVGLTTLFWRNIRFLVPGILLVVVMVASYTDPVLFYPSTITALLTLLALEQLKREPTPGEPPEPTPDPTRELDEARVS
jgi:O-antigen ligase